MGFCTFHGASGWLLRRVSVASAEPYAIVNSKNAGFNLHFICGSGNPTRNLKTGKTTVQYSVVLGLHLSLRDPAIPLQVNYLAVSHEAATGATFTKYSTPLF
jgi:hypothetical protein